MIIYWAPLFHFYQPPTQTRDILAKVTKESYRPLLEVIESYPHAKAAVNINGVLTEMLAESGYMDVINKLRELAQGGQVEFTGSAMYHPILPLIPTEEVKRQIKRNHLVNRDRLGDVYQPRGFFSPEMCYSKDILDPVMETRHEWLIVSGVACPVAWPMNVVHEAGTEKERIAVVFRDDILSNKISFKDLNGKEFVQHLRSLHREDGGDIYVVTAMDAETFGHHIQHWEELFLAEAYKDIAPSGSPSGGSLRRQMPLDQQARKLFEMQRGGAEENMVEIVTISELLDLFPRGSRVEPKPSSWSTTDNDIKAGDFYPLWKANGNKLHEMLWEHLRIAQEVLHKALGVADNPDSRRFAEIARGMLDPALHSDQFWWASKRPMWDVNMIHRGLNLQRDVTFNATKAVMACGCDEAVKRDCHYQVLAARWVQQQILDMLLYDQVDSVCSASPSTKKK